MTDNISKETVWTNGYARNVANHGRGSEMTALLHQACDDMAAATKRIEELEAMVNRPVGMTEERISEIASEFYPFLAQDNDEIANDPSRWHEELTSWSMNDIIGVVAALISKAVKEAMRGREAVPTWEQLIKAWYIIGADLKGLKWCEFVSATAQPLPRGTKDE